MNERPIEHPLLRDCGAPHGFGVRGARAPEASLRPRQVHGTQVARVAPLARAGARAALDREEADAVVSTLPGQPIAIVTADCVPVLAASRDGAGVAAIHAGWRGLAAGIVTRGVETLQADTAAPLSAVIGPHIGPCCYEVDAPVLDALRARFGSALDAACEASRPGHAHLDLGALTALELEDCGIARDCVARLPHACTRCDASRFHSYRRDGARAGRLVHHISAATGPNSEA